jgi:hypothetical protein
LLDGMMGNSTKGRDAVELHQSSPFRISADFLNL